MPFIHITSLPLDDSLEVDAVIQRLSASFAEANEIGIEHVTVTWQFVDHFVEGGMPMDTGSVLVDLLAPDFNSVEAIEKMLVTTASSITELTGIALDSIFINARQAHSGMVFDKGEIVRW